jgi:hypothetical protein
VNSPARAARSIAVKKQFEFLLSLPLFWVSEGEVSPLAQSTGQTPLPDAFLRTHHAGKSATCFNRHVVVLLLQVVERIDATAPDSGRCAARPGAAEADSVHKYSALGRRRGVGGRQDKEINVR